MEEANPAAALAFSRPPPIPIRRAKNLSFGRLAFSVATLTEQDLDDESLAAFMGEIEAEVDAETAAKRA